MSEKQNFDQDWIKKFILSLIQNNNKKINNEYCSETELLKKIIVETHCEMNDVHSIYKTMKNMGLELCIVKIPSSPFDESSMMNFSHQGKYDLVEFASIRGYFD